MGISPLVERVSWRPMDLPSKTNDPDVAGYSPARTRAIVDLPEPDSPTRATISPGATSKETSSIACSCPRERKPPTRKSRVKSWTFKIASGIVPFLSSHPVAPYLVIAVGDQFGAHRSTLVVRVRAARREEAPHGWVHQGRRRPGDPGELLRLPE